MMKSIAHTSNGKMESHCLALTTHALPAPKRRPVFLKILIKRTPERL